MHSKKELMIEINEENKISILIQYLIYSDLELQELIVDKLLIILSTKSFFSITDKNLLTYLLSIDKLKYLVLKFLCEFPIEDLEPYLIGIYLYDKDSLNRVEAADALWNLEKNYNGLFFRGLEDKNELVRAYSISNMNLEINNNILNKILQLEKIDKSLIVRIACRNKLFFVTKDKKWIKKIYSNITSKNYHAAIWAIRSIEEAIDEDLLEIEEIKEIILNANKNEKRSSVKGNLEDFIKNYINK